MKEYKIITASSNWSCEKARKKMELAINEYAQRGWRVVSVSFAPYYNYKALATLERDVEINDFV